MSKFKVIVTEILSREVEIEAESAVDAEIEVENMYRNCEIVLDDFDFHGDVSFNAVKLKENEM